MTNDMAKISRKRSLQSVYFTAPEANKPVRIVSTLPRRLSGNKKAREEPSDNPHQFLMTYLTSQGINAKVQRFDAVGDLFEEPKQAEIDAYGFEALDAVRTRDIEKLKDFHKEGRPLKCSNRFGESILHLACRKGFPDVVDFLINIADVPVCVKDDFGRSPMHDACWTVTPNFELMDLLVEKAPDLLLVSDARGHTPLDYARREHWKKWVDYLTEKGTKLMPEKFTLKAN